MTEEVEEGQKKEEMEWEHPYPPSQHLTFNKI